MSEDAIDWILDANRIGAAVSAIRELRRRDPIVAEGVVDGQRHGAQKKRARSRAFSRAMLR